MAAQMRNYAPGEISAPTIRENPTDLEGASARREPTSSLQGGGDRVLAKKVLCPSAPADDKAILLGVIQSDRSVAFLKDRIPVTHEFLDIVGKDRVPENQFRFSSPCLGSVCKQWVNGGCSLPERLGELIKISDSTHTPLPQCSIREECRWFIQRGAEACHICPLVVTRGNS